MGISEDRLPGWTFLPVASASLATGTLAALTFLGMSLLRYPRPFAEMLNVELILALVTVTLFGLIVGLIFVLPIAMIFSAIGIRLSLRKPWVSYRRTWATAGAVVGAIVLLVPFLIPNYDDPSYGPIALFGAASGVTAALLCHRFLRVGKD